MSAEVHEFTRTLGGGLFSPACRRCGVPAIKVGFARRYEGTEILCLAPAPGPASPSHCCPEPEPGPDVIPLRRRLLGTLPLSLRLAVLQLGQAVEKARRLKDEGVIRDGQLASFYSCLYLTIRGEGGDDDERD